MGVCEDAPDEYCGHVLEPEEREADDDWHEETRNAVCLREPKYDGLCVWHADTDEKTAEELVRARLTPDDVSWETESVKENLNGAILREIKFPEGFLFGECILVLADFHDADLSEAEFSDADLRYTEFPDADLFEAGFSGADLCFTEFSDAYLFEAEFSDADLLYAEFPDADLKHAKFPDADLSEAEFSDADLRYAELPDADLFEAGFPDADLCFTEFPRADLRYAEFPDADLRYSEFPDTSLSSAEFPRANLKEAEFPHADLKHAEFPHADLTEAEFQETTLRGINLTEANLREAEFLEADLRDARFRPEYARAFAYSSTTDRLGASLEDAQFEDGTDLRGADLSGARIYQTAFRDVRINDETRFGIEDENPYGTACRYEYDPNTGVSINEDTSRFEAAAWTYRRLESLFEENAMGERARNAHIRKEEAQRAHRAKQLESNEWVEENGFYPDSWPKSLGEYAVSTVNWHLHRHGESLRRLLSVSGLLILLCGVLYSGAGIARSSPETTYRLTPTDLTNPGAALVDLLNGLYFSVITFSTIGYGDFYPASPLSRLLVGIESLAGALFLALFVFVIGRRVAR